MKRTEVIKAQQEAKRFLEKVEPALNYFKDRNGENIDWQTCGTKETAALKRASLDLTRALADMRKS